MRSTTTHGRDGGPLLHAYCHLCERWRVLDRGGVWREGSSPPPVAQCPDCGEFGLVKARLPLAMRPIDELPSEHWRTPGC